MPWAMLIIMSIILTMYHAFLSKQYAHLCNASAVTLQATRSFAMTLHDKHKVADEDVHDYQGLSWSSIQWGPWSSGGMAASAQIATRLRRAGLVLISPVQGVLALGKVSN